jgi:hypothetical protein
MPGRQFGGNQGPQTESIFFFQLPSEVRCSIYQYAVTEYSISEDSYDINTCYTRPDYSARSYTDTTILQTCQRVDYEAWSIPWRVRQHVYFLADKDHQPDRAATIAGLWRALARICKIHEVQTIAVEYVQVFAQLQHLEPGYQLQGLLGLTCFRPKLVTITLRHTDWRDSIDMCRY